MGMAPKGGMARSPAERCWVGRRRPPEGVTGDVCEFFAGATDDRTVLLSIVGLAWTNDVRR